MRESLPSLDQFKWTMPLTTRWRDNDVYGHMNNVVYYALFDTVANTFLIDEGGLDFRNDEAIAYVVQSDCNYAKQIAYPDSLTGALRVAKLGTSSVRYQIGIFRDGENDAAAFGNFTHVLVNRESSRPEPIQGKMREALTTLLV